MSEFLTQFMERRGELLELTIEHMEMTSLAVLASLIVGGLIGIAITKNDKAAAIVIGIANLMQSIPASVCWPLWYPLWASVRSLPLSW